MFHGTEKKRVKGDEKSAERNGYVERNGHAREGHGEKDEHVQSSRWASLHADKRQSSLMKDVAHDLTDQDVDAVAAYFDQLALPTAK
jgi:hypothetical protein